MKPEDQMQLEEMLATDAGREEIREVWRELYPDNPYPDWLTEPDTGVQAPKREETKADSGAEGPESTPRQKGLVMIDVPASEQTGQVDLPQDASRPWGPLPGREPPGSFPLDALPALGREMASTVAGSVQVSPDMAACLVLGALSAAAVGQAGVRINADYQEPCHLFIALGANPSERKSASMGMVFRSLYEFEREENLRRAPAIRHYEEMRGMLEDHLARARKAGDGMKVADLVDELNALQEVKPFRLILNDATPEALSSAMAKNDGRMAMVSSEGAFFNILAGGYSANGAANVDVVLKGYSGEPVRVERIGRAGEQMERACLSLCLAVQPDMLHDFLTDPTLAGRGMASRFLAAMPESRVGERDDEGVPADPLVMDRFALRLWRLLQLEQPLTLGVSPQARVLYRDWYREVEDELKSGGSLAEVGQGWGGKLCGNTMRIAGLLQMLKDDKEEIDEAAMTGAIRIARWFSGHAMRLMCGEENLSPEANETLALLIRRNQPKVSEAAVRHSAIKRSALRRPDAFKLALAELIADGYVRREEAKQASGAGRKPGPVLLLHPGLLQRRSSLA